ncbi:hypothetical protein FACS189450_14510 [Spirochaetia bacterium]|nr:hypothetical protein FACS189450_14510 [Spirochaetia bacterium]
MALRKKGDIIGIKYYKENYTGYFSRIISIGIACGIIIKYYNRFNSKYEWVNMALHSNLIKALLIIGLVLFIIFSIMNTLFGSDFNYYMDLETNKIHLINGKWKFRSEEIIDFENVKSIIIRKTEYMETRYKKGDIYKIDLYDKELNAYEIFDSINFSYIKKVANDIQKITNAEIIEMIDIINYEEFKRRII